MYVQLAFHRRFLIIIFRQGSNALNKSVQGLWSAHRRTKVNLNAPIPTPTTPGPAADLTPTTEQMPEESAAAVTALPDTSTPPAKRRARTRNAEEGSSSKRSKLSASAREYTPPAARLSDLGGVEGCIEKMLEFVAMPLNHPEIYLHMGVQPPRGVLLHGPPGCGKTLLANAIAGVRVLSGPRNFPCVLTVLQELGVPFISISAPSIVSGMSGESEKTLRDAFEEAKVGQLSQY